MLEPFIAFLGLIPSGTSLAIKLPMICRATDFPSCQMPRCQATKLPKYSMTKPSCQIIELSNFQSCRAAELPSCRSVELQSCRAAKLPKYRVAICQAAAGKLTICKMPSFRIYQIFEAFKAAELPSCAFPR